MTFNVFVCYSHDDRRWLGLLRDALAPFESAETITVFDDRSIATGQRWNAKIDEALQAADVAVLLVSSAFFASDFIREVELPRIIDAASTGRLSIVWVPVSSSAWHVTALEPFQAALDPTRPLDLMTAPEALAALVRVADKVASAKSFGAVARFLQRVDEIAESTDPSATPSVSATATNNAVIFTDRTGASLTEIRPEDFDRLPKHDLALIRALEQSMNRAFEQWTLLRSRRPVWTDTDRLEYQQAGSLMCEELRHILDFIENQLGKQLYDHYNGIRYACDQITAT